LVVFVLEEKHFLKVLSARAMFLDGWSERELKGICVHLGTSSPRDLFAFHSPILLLRICISVAEQRNEPQMLGERTNGDRRRHLWTPGESYNEKEGVMHETKS
jgi:hypothetical protein